MVQERVERMQERVERNGLKMAQANAVLNTLNKDKYVLLTEEIKKMPETLIPVFQQVWWK
jgi:hypothetical protein